MSNDNPRERLAQAALDSVRGEYAELSDQWRALDSKAQATGAVAGVLLAGLFAFVRENATGNDLATFLVALATILALAAAFLVVLALQIRTVEPPPVGEQVLRLIENVSEKSGSDEELSTRITLLLNDQRKLWTKPISSTRVALHSKAKSLAGAQWALLGALLALSVTVVHRLLF